MENFTPWSALAGGALIGLGATLLLLGNGRIAGISGIVGSLLGRWREPQGWRLAFLTALVAVPALAAVFVAPAFSPRDDWPLGLVALAGLLVGVGTRIGSGCTSGHGVCGLARASKRSLVATLTFMATGVLTASLLTPVLVEVLR